MAGKYELKKTTNNQFRWTLIAANGEPLLTSETYVTKQGAENGIAAAMRQSGSLGNYSKLTARDGSPYFNLLAGNNQVLGTSETYSAATARDRGIAACMNYGPTAPTEDLT